MRVANFVVLNTTQKKVVDMFSTHKNAENKIEELKKSSADNFVIGCKWFLRSVNNDDVLNMGSKLWSIRTSWLVRKNPNGGQTCRKTFKRN